MQSVLAINPVSSPPSAGLEGSGAAADGGFALAFGEGSTSEEEEPSGDAYLFPVHAFAAVRAGVGGAAGAADPAAGFGMPVAVAAPVEAVAIRPGALTEAAETEGAPALAGNGGTAAKLLSAGLPQPGLGLPAPGSIGSEGNGVEDAARGDDVVVAWPALASGPSGDAGKGRPTLPGSEAGEGGAKDPATGAIGFPAARREPAPVPPENRQAQEPTTPVDRGKAAAAVPAPHLTAAGALSAEPDLETVLSRLPDTGEAVSAPRVPVAVRVAVSRQPEPETPGVELPPTRTDSVVQTTADPSTRAPGQPLARPGATQHPLAGTGEPLSPSAPPEHGQPHSRQPGFWERFFTGVHAASVAEAVTMAPEPPAPVSLGALSGAQADGIGETCVLQPDADPPEDAVQDPKGQPTATTPALSAAAAQFPVAARLSPDPAFDPLSGQETDAEADQALAALSVGLPAMQGPPSAGAAPPATLPVPKVAAQIVSGLSRNPEGTTDIALAPEELGHVRLKLKPDATNPDRMVVMITFERPETLDLFRRNAGELTEALRTAGYAGVDIGFGREGGGGSESDRPRHAVSSGFDRTAGPDGTHLAETAPRLMAGASLDLRL